MNKYIIALVVSLVLCLGCSATKRNSSDKQRFFYAQDSYTGVVFCCSRGEYTNVYASIPTDQIDAVKNLVENYKEPSFLTEWKKNNGK